MPAASSRLTSKRIEVLNWVGSGGPDGLHEGYRHRGLACGLAARGLVKVKGRGAEWTRHHPESGSDWKPSDLSPRPTTKRTASPSAPAVVVHPIARVRRGTVSKPTTLSSTAAPGSGREGTQERRSRALPRGLESRWFGRLLSQRPSADMPDVLRQCGRQDEHQPCVSLVEQFAVHVPFGMVRGVRDIADRLPESIQE